MKLLYEGSHSLMQNAVCVVCYFFEALNVPFCCLLWSITKIYGLFYYNVFRAEHLCMSVHGRVMWIWWHCCLLLVVQM